MIVEGIITTADRDRRPHVAAMGAATDDEFRKLTLRPFASSETHQNLTEHGAGVFHLTDDIELLARAAIHRLNRIPEFIKASTIDGWVLPGCCRAFEFRITAWEHGEGRSSLECIVTKDHRLRDFVGFHRARHAILELAILATRLHLVSYQEVIEASRRWFPLVEKTGGLAEHRTWQLLQEYIAAYYQVPE